ncbi:MAG: hypothetical protein ABWX82_04830 [Leifsonia sp.]
MPQLITEDDLDRLDDAYGPDVDTAPDDMLSPEYDAWEEENAISPAGHLEMAEIIERWATDSSAYELGGQLTAPILLLIAAEHRHAADDIENAERLARQARDHADAEPFEAHPTFIAFALAAGDAATAAGLADEVEHARPTDLAFYTMIGESYEEHDDERTAERWYTLGLEMMVRTGETDDPEYLGLLISRSMLRKDMGLPADDFDRYVELLADEDQ